MVSRVCLVSGGTGGHLVPALVLARALRDRGHETVLVTEGRPIERALLERERLVDAEGDGAVADPPVAAPHGAVETLGIPAGQRSALRLPLWLWRATMSARRLLREQGVDCVVGTGGRASVPVGLAARTLGKPLFLLEQNAVAGRANRLLRRFATRTYLGLPGPTAPVGRGLLTGTPLRAELFQADRAAARADLGLDQTTPVVLVTGGSQGAQRLNELMPEALSALGRPLQVLHLAGPGRAEPVRLRYDAADRVRALVDEVRADMPRLLAAADLVVCRGGGTTVAELAAVGRAAVIVPYPHHRDRQQLRNGQVLESAGAAVVVEEHELSVDRMRAVLAPLLGDPRRLAEMSAAAHRLCGGDPTATILEDMERQGGLR